MRDEAALHHVIELARLAIRALKPLLAIQQLKTIQCEVEELVGAGIQAEYRLTLAEALAAMNDPSAESEFDEALQCVTNLPERNRILELRAHENCGRFLMTFRHRPSAALPHFEAAKKMAIELGFLEDSARIQLCLTELKLEIDKNPQIKSFQVLRQVGAEYTRQEQLAAWAAYRTLNSDQVGLLAARHRSVASPDYFRALLESIRSSESEVAD